MINTLKIRTSCFVDSEMRAEVHGGISQAGELNKYCKALYTLEVLYKWLIQIKKNLFVIHA